MVRVLSHLSRTYSGAMSAPAADGVTPLGSLLAGFLLQALSPAEAMAVVAAGMAVTAATATALPPVRNADRGDKPPPAAFPGSAPAAEPGGA